jgi:hypothetical protein
LLILSAASHCKFHGVVSGAYQQSKSSGAPVPFCGPGAARATAARVWSRVPMTWVKTAGVMMAGSAIRLTEVKEHFRICR